MYRSQDVIVCPNCRKIAEKKHWSLRYSEGNPLRKCRHCGGIYVDPYCFEQALKPYRDMGLGHCLVLAGVLGGAAGILTFFGGAVISDLELGIRNIVGPLLIGFVCAAGTFAYAMKRLEGMNKERRAKWDESDRRLQNPAYAYRLKKGGFHVPEQYTDNDIVRRMEAEEKTKEEADLKKLKQEQIKRRKAQYYLSRGKRSPEVQEQADNLQITPEEVLEACKKCVADYDEIHRQYNLTHYPPAEYPSDY